MYGTKADTQFAHARAVVSRVFVVAGATCDGESGDSNLGRIVLFELFGEALDSMPVRDCSFISTLHTYEP